MAKLQRRILIVDDSLAEQELYRRRLQRNPHADYEIYEATLGETGLRICATAQPDCILLDYRLPDLNGIQFLERLHAQTQGLSPAVVVITASGSERVAVDALQHGAQDYLVKGTTTREQLWRAVDNAIEKAALQRNVEEQQRELAASEEQYRLLIEALEEGIVVHRANGMILSCNPSAERILGVSAAQLMNCSSFETLGPCIHEDGTPFSGDTHPAMVTLRTGQPQSNVIMGVQMPEKQLRWLSINSRSLVPPGEITPTTVVMSFSDITERKLAEAERERLLTELQRINAEFQQFSYIVSHDLNEPLRTISMYVQLLAQRAKGNSDTEAEEEMTFVIEAAQRLQQMLADLLAYTRAGQTPEFTTVDCKAVVTQVLHDLQKKITDCGALFTHDPLPVVQANETRLRQVLQNLIDNALKFSRPAIPPHVHLSAQREENSWKFSIRDNGLGIDPKQAGRLFQVFQRFHTSSEYPGTGIGLAICKRIIEQHGGRIWAESALGEGTTIYFTLPGRAERD